MDSRKRALLLRVGGLGDCIILTVVAKQLYAKGYLVDLFVGSPTGDVHEFFNGLPYINETKKITRVNGVDCIEVAEKTYISVDIIRSKYDEVFDFKYSVEDNRVGNINATGWRSSINSNYTNWVDLSLGWANIDPIKVAREDKIPEINIPENLTTWAIGILGKFDNRDHRVVGIQLQASTLIRTWYRSDELPRQIHQRFPNDLVVIWANNAWHILTKNGQQKIEFPEGNSLLASAALVQQMDVFICADSGMSHITEAVGTKSICIYTTVPSWTRSKYYVNTMPIEASPECFPCFTLHPFCPLEMKKAEETLSDREKEIVIAGRNNVSIHDIAKKFNTVPGAIMAEFKSAQQRVEALSASEPACVKSITSKMILDKLSGIISEKKKLTSNIINLSDAVLVGEVVS